MINTNQDIEVTMTTKLCVKCQETKDISEFTFAKRKCPIGKHCHSCQKAKGKEEYQKRREMHLKYRKEYYEKNKIEILAKTKTDEYKQDRNLKKKIRRKHDIQFRIGESLKIRIHEVLKEYKEDSSNYLLGCKKKHIVSWLTYQLNNELTWENYAEYWHIDHVIPISFFDMEQRREHLICFNWMNLRPLEKSKNIAKFNNILMDDIEGHIENLERFITANNEYQECYNNSIWPRVKLGYGDNLTDNESFSNFLQSVIRNQ